VELDPVLGDSANIVGCEGLFEDFCTVTASVKHGSINAVMVGMVDHAAHVIWDAATEGQAPKTDKGLGGGRAPRDPTGGVRNADRARWHWAGRSRLGTIA
jgi:hypothetical protein